MDVPEHEDGDKRRRSWKNAFLACEAGVELDVFFQKKLGSGLFGGEGLFNTVISGPGHIWLHSMPVPQLAGALLPYLPIKS